MMNLLDNNQIKYKEAWIEAERDLAINSYQILGWLSELKQDFGKEKNIPNSPPLPLTEKKSADKVLNDQIVAL